MAKDRSNAQGRHRRNVGGSRWRRLLAPVAMLALVFGVLQAAPVQAAGAGVVSVNETFVNTTTGAPITSVDPLDASMGGKYRVDVAFSCLVANCDSTTVAIAPNVKDPYYNQFVLESAGYTFTPPFPGATATGTVTTGITVNLGNLTAGTAGVFQIIYTVQNRPGIGNAEVGNPSPGSMFPNGFVIPSHATISSPSSTGDASASASATWVSRTGPPTFSISVPASSRTDVPVTIQVGSAPACNYFSSFNFGTEVYQCAKSYTWTSQLPADAVYVANSATGGGVYDPVARTVTWTGSGIPAARGPLARTYQATIPSTAVPTTGANCVAPEVFSANVQWVLLDGTVQTPAAQSGTLQAQNCAPFAKASAVTKTPMRTSGSVATTIPIPSAIQAAFPGEWHVVVGNMANVPGVATITDTELDQPDVAVFEIWNQSAVAVHADYTLDNGTTGTVNIAAGGTFVVPSGRIMSSATVTSDPLTGPNGVSTGTAQTQMILNFYFNVSPGATPGAHTNHVSSTMDYPGYSLPQQTSSTQATTTLVPTAATPPVLTAGAAGPTVTGGGNAITGGTVTWGVSGTIGNAPNSTTIVPQYVFIAPAGWNVTGTSWSSPPPAGTILTQSTATIAGQTRNVVVATWPAPISVPASGVGPALPQLFVVTTPTSAAPAGPNNTATMLFGDSNDGTNTYSTPYTEPTDLDGDGTIEQYSSATRSISVTGTPALSVLKEICKPDSTGACTWISNSSVVVGVPPTANSIQYRITITNSGNAQANNITAYDVLPYLNDVGTSDATAGTPRGSTVQESLNSVSNVPSDVTLAYSSSTNPPRPGVFTGATSGDWTAPAAGAAAIQATIASLPAGASRTFTYEAALVGGAADKIACNSVAGIATSLTAVEPAAVCATTQEADMSIAGDTHFPLQVGRVSTVPFVVENHGGSQQSSATVTLHVPADLTIATLTIPNWDCQAPGLTGPVDVTCTPVDGSGASRQLQKDAPETIPLQVTPTAAAGANVCIDADIASIMNDPVASNDTASVCSTVVDTAKLISVTKSDGVTQASPGDTLTYTITATNNIVDDGLTGVLVTDTLPTNVKWVSGGTVSGQDSDGLGGTVSFGAVDLAAAGTADADGDTGSGATGSATTFTVTVQVADTASGDIVNNAKVLASDPATAATLTDTDSDTDHLQRLSVTKTSSAPAAGVRKGDTVTYTVTLTNDGTVDYTTGDPAKVLDDLSGVLDDATYVSGTASVDGGVPTAISPNASDHIVWSGALATGKSVVITYSVTIGDGGDKVVKNTAYASGAVGTSCTDGLDQNGISCATTQSIFAPLIGKRVQSLVQNDDGTWTIVYAIDVTNPSPVGTSTYNLTDTLKFGAGIQVLSASAAMPAGVSPASPAWSGSGAIATGVALPGGAQQTYVVTVDADAKQVAGTAAAQCVTGAAGGFDNQATIAVAGIPDTAAEACAAPVEPTIAKTVHAPVQQPDGTWNVSYTVTVTNTNKTPTDLAYTVKDALGFPAGTTIKAVTTTGPGASGAFNGTSAQALLTGVGRIPAPTGAQTSTTQVYTVTVNVDAPVGAVSPADLLCGATSGGYANTATLFAGSSTTSLGAASACAPISVAPLPTITKKVISSAVGTDGDWTLVYQIDVANTDPTFSTFYDLGDQLDFAPGVTVTSAAVTSSPTSVTTNSAWNGASDTSIVQGQQLGAGQTDTYQVTVVADPGALDAESALADCRLDSGETGTGFLNVGTVTAGVKSATASACEPFTDPSVVKTVSQQPTQDPATGIWTVKYQISVTNRSTTTSGTIDYTVDDALALPAGVTIVDVKGAAGAGGATTESDFDGQSHNTLVNGSIGAAADDTHPATQLYTVTVRFTEPAGATAGLACDPAQGPGGLQNVGEIHIGPRVSASVACVDAPDVPTPTLTKTITGEKQQADGTWAVDYTITVANPSTTAASRYSLDDAFDLGAGMAVTSATVDAPNGVTKAAGWNGGASTDLADNVLLPAGGSHTYTVHAVVDAGSVKGTDAAGDCTLAGGETGTGLRNTAHLDTGAATADQSACATTFDPGVTKTLDGVPIEQADGSWLLAYTMTVTNPANVQLSYGLDDSFDFPTGTVATVESATGPGARADWDGGGQPVLVNPGQSLAPNAVDQFHVTVRAVLPSGQKSAADGWQNTATVGSGTGGVITSAATAKADIALPSLEVGKSVTTTSPAIRIGDTVSYEVTVTNTGDGDFTGLYPAVVWDDMTGVLDDASLNGTPVVTPTAGMVTTSSTGYDWRGALAHGDSVTIDYTVTAKGGGDAKLLNVAFGAAPDDASPATPKPADCAAPGCASTDTAMPALLVQKKADELMTTPDGDVHYTVTVTNTGGADIPDAEAATVTDDLSGVLANASYSGDAATDKGTVAVTGSTLTWEGGLKAGETATITYSVQVDSHAPLGTSLVNVAIADPTLATLGLGGGPAASRVSVTTAVGLLAFTGTEVSAAIIAGGVLVLLGLAALLIVWRRRRRSGSLGVRRA